MRKTTPGNAGAESVHGRRTDVGRRVAARREELALTREELAARSGAAPGYIEYIEERSATPGIGIMLRLADALETTVPDLTGGTVNQPPGRSSGLGTAQLLELDEEECFALLSTHGVGRVAGFSSEGPSIMPVNYLVADGEIAFRTAPDTVPAAAAGAEVAFEVDRIDDTFSQGWSVLVVGKARAVTDHDAVRRLEGEARSLPWAGGERNLWVVVPIGRISGRRVSATA
ncbi:helix-turn-helix domain-containing protein [Streptomyces sp. NPDC001820]|uniref:helix-turn-helix domain-containing protein n=1 Tax=Streptomyces sp. NPDC001820 TaxID=3364613 RepID=UPI0036AC9C06